MSDAALTLKSVYKLVGGVQQRRWYISNQTVPLFGAIEGKAWRRIAPQGNVDVPDLLLTALPRTCSAGKSSSENSAVALILHRVDEGLLLCDCALGALGLPAHSSAALVADALYSALADPGSESVSDGVGRMLLLPACLWASSQGLDMLAGQCFEGFLADKAVHATTHRPPHPFTCFGQTLPLQPSAQCLLGTAALVAAEHWVARGDPLAALRALSAAGEGPSARGLRALTDTMLGMPLDSDKALLDKDDDVPLACRAVLSSVQTPTPTLPSLAYPLLRHTCHILQSSSAHLPSLAVVSNLLLLGQSAAAAEHVGRAWGCLDCRGGDSLQQAAALHRALLTACPLGGSGSSCALLLQSGTLALFIHTTLLVASPTVHQHELGPSSALPGSLAACRRELEATLTYILQLCSAPGTLCVLDDPASRIGVRGLFLLAYQGGSLAELSQGRVDPPDHAVPAVYFDLMKRTQPQWAWAFHPALPARAPAPRTLRVAFVSAFFFRHPVGRLLAQVILGLAADPAFDVHVVDLSASSSISTSSSSRDDLTLALRRGLGSRYHHADSSAALQADPAQFLRSLALDVVVFGDVFMDTATAHVAMLRVAPRAVAFWGHPHTTGFDSIDYFVSSALFEADGARAGHFSEQLVQFDSLTFQIYPQEEAGPTAGGQDREGALSRLLDRAVDFDGLPAFHRYRVGPAHNEIGARVDLGSARLYGCLQSLFKYHPLLDDALLSILRRDEQAVLLLQRNAVGMGRFVERLARLTEAWARQEEGGKGARALLTRILFVGPAAQRQYLEVVCALDVVLDPFPFGGGLTLVDAVSCPDPVPFVTAGGLQTVHMLGQGIARALVDIDADDGQDAALPCGYALGHVTANSVEGFAETAVRVAGQRHACRLKGETSGEDQAEKRRQRVQRVLYDDVTGAVQEWAHFLKRI